MIERACVSSSEAIIKLIPLSQPGCWLKDSYSEIRNFWFTDDVTL